MVKKTKTESEVDGAELERKTDVNTHAKIVEIRDHFIALAKKQGREVKYKYFPRHYYDTPDLDLHSHGISLRLQREKHRGYKQTVKYELSPDHILGKGEVYRMERPDIITGCRPDFNQITDPVVRKLIAPFRNEPLIYIGTADFERDYFNLLFGKGKEKGLVELAFDIGHYDISGVEEPFPRFKIENERMKGSHLALSVARDEIFAFSETKGDIIDDPYKSKSDEITSLYREHKQKVRHARPPQR